MHCTFQFVDKEAGQRFPIVSVHMADKLKEFLGKKRAKLMVKLVSKYLLMVSKDKVILYQSEQRR